jgi:signal transduction histidine kinase
MQAAGARLGWLPVSWSRAASLIGLLGVLALIVGREVEAFSPPRALLVAIATAVLAASWLLATRDFSWQVVGLLATSSIALIALGHFLSGTLGLTAALTGLAITRELRVAIAAAFVIGLPADGVLLAVLAPLPPIHIVFIDVFWVLAFLLGRYVRIARAAQSRAEELLVERERSAALQERARIAREVHDILAHTLSALTVQLEATRAALPAGASKSEVERAGRLARRGLEEVSWAVAALHGQHQRGLAALDELVAGFGHDTGITAQLEMQADPARVSAEAQFAIYRVAQEALTNVRRHSRGANRVVVSVGCSRDEIALKIEDDGDGSAGPQPAGGGHGLAGMKERAELLGGGLVVGPTPNGFAVNLRLPR